MEKNQNHLIYKLFLINKMKGCGLKAAIKHKNNLMITICCDIH